MALQKISHVAALLYSAYTLYIYPADDPAHALKWRHIYCIVYIYIYCIVYVCICLLCIYIYTADDPAHALKWRHLLYSVHCTIWPATVVTLDSVANGGLWLVSRWYYNRLDFFESGMLIDK